MAEREGSLLIVGFDTEYPSGMGISNPYFTKVSVFQVPMAGYLDKDSQSETRLRLTSEYLIPGVVT